MIHQITPVTLLRAFGKGKDIYNCQIPFQKSAPLWTLHSMFLVGAFPESPLGVFFFFFFFCPDAQASGETLAQAGQASNQNS